MGNNHYVLANDMIIGYSWLMVTNHLVYHYHRIITITNHYNNQYNNHYNNQTS